MKNSDKLIRWLFVFPAAIVSLLIVSFFMPFLFRFSLGFVMADLPLWINNYIIPWSVNVGAGFSFIYTAFRYYFFNFFNQLFIII